MAPESVLIASGIRDNLRRHGHQSPLRFVTCGSAGDGQRTLIGRLPAESRIGVVDPVAGADPGNAGAPGGATAVAGRIFDTERRTLIVADTAGHEPNTRRLVTGASTADLAVILVDARKGLLTPTRRHSLLVHLMGIRKVVLAVNKMDLVDYDQAVFDRIDEAYRGFASRIGLTDVTSIPLSALEGDHLNGPSAAMPWYRGPLLMPFLESCELDESRLQQLPLRLPVQSVHHPNPDVRGFCGPIASGTLETGQRVRIQPSGRETRIARIVAADGDRPRAVAGERVAVTLADEVDVSPGDLISSADSPAEVADQFECALVWMADEPMLPGRPYLMKIGARTVGMTVTEPKYRLSLDTLEHVAAKQFGLDEIGVCNIALDRAVPFDAYAANRGTGGFVVIDRLSNKTVGAGMLHFALRRAHNIHLQHLDVDRAARSAIKGQQPVLLWFTGLSGSGKSTIANLVERQLLAMGRHSYLLDGDNVRHGLNKDLGFTAADRVENIRRIAEVAKLMVDAGLIVLTAFISPFRAERRMARGLLAEGEFIEIHVDTPLEVAERRDVKGLYKKARAGQLKNFTGIDSPYEAPEQPEIRIDTTAMSAEEAADRIVGELRDRGLLPG